MSAAHGSSGAPPLLSLRGFGVAFGKRPVLAHVDMDLPASGMVVLMGSAGSGKSTLLRTLAGVNDAHPAFTRWGRAEIGGRPLFELPHEQRRIGLVTQHSRFFTSTVRENLVSTLPNRSALSREAQTEFARKALLDAGLASLVPQLLAEVVELPLVAQRQLAIVQKAASDPLLLLADEPTSGLVADDARDLLGLLRALAETRTVLFVTHNQMHARASGGTTLLLAGGRIVERDATPRFFDDPKSDPARWFLRTGGSCLPSPAAESETLDPQAERPSPIPSYARELLAKTSPDPRGFFWVEDRRLGGLPRPGLLNDLEADLEGLRGLGITALVTLEEERTVDPARLRELAIDSIHFPVPDMGAPSIEDARALCAVVQERLALGAVVAFHCRAGLGRTGTLLAAQLVFVGESALRAIERVRQISPMSIQSQAQVQFLRAFEGATAKSEKPPRS